MMESTKQRGVEGHAAISKAHAGDRAKAILIMRYMQDMTLDQVGHALGITRERVRQIEAKTMSAIRGNKGLRERAISVLTEGR